MQSQPQYLGLDIVRQRLPGPGPDVLDEGAAGVDHGADIGAHRLHVGAGQGGGRSDGVRDQGQGQGQGYHLVGDEKEFPPD